jgi:hypothetical protein
MRWKGLHDDPDPERGARVARQMTYRFFRTFKVGLAAPNLAELEVAKRNQVSEKEPP